ncbi:FAD-dependent monooxygenase [Actinoplanes sp. NPDC051861]|uniref:FAD-dependent monooxygenase n=1 Tax=Actinoplanes sp. NPDC051861 TaxID=3155170 RepID=UPI00342CD4BF
MFTESVFTVIVGAGPTGLTLARDLGRRGVPFRIFEQAPGSEGPASAGRLSPTEGPPSPSPLSPLEGPPAPLEGPFAGSRGKGLQPRTLEVLDDLGLLPEISAFGAEYPVMLVRQPDGTTVTWRMDELHEATPSVPYPNMLMIPQWRTSSILASSVPVEFGVAVTGFEQRDDSVIVSLDTGETVVARYLVGADGGRSVVRRTLGIPFEGETREEERMLIADVTVTGLDRSHWHVWPELRVGLCPLPGTDQFQLTAPPSELSIVELLASVDPSITVTHVGWTSEYRANMRMAARFRSGNVFLAGDAAHVHSPAGGQGLNTGVQDAYNLGWKLATGDSALLDTYEAERLPVAADVLGISTRLHRGHVTNGQSSSTVRRDDPVLRQLSLNYRHGPLASECRTSPGEVQAGDRAPDALIDSGRIFDLLRGPHATLLAFGWSERLPDLPDGIRVHHVDAFKAYDVREPTLFLIRPDGYVGCATHNPSDVVAYAEQISGALLPQ